MKKKFIFQNNNSEWHIFKLDNKNQYPECLCGHLYDITHTLETSKIIVGERNAQVEACNLAGIMCETCVRELYRIPMEVLAF